MAPVPCSSSPAKGKTRVYMCKTCEVRHAPPTGARCPLARTARMTPSSSRALGLKCTVSRRITAAVGGTSRTRGRSVVTTNVDQPRHSSRRLVTSRHNQETTSSIPSTEEETDTDSLDDFPQSSQVNGRKRARSSFNDTSPSKRSASAPAPRRSGPGAVLPTPGGTESPLTPQPTQDNGTTMILQQLAAMQESNRREFARLESEGRQERLRMEADHRTATEQLQAEHRGATESIHRTLENLQSQQPQAARQQVQDIPTSAFSGAREPIPSTSRATITPARQPPQPPQSRHKHHSKPYHSRGSHRSSTSALPLWPTTQRPSKHSGETKEQPMWPPSS